MGIIVGDEMTGKEAKQPKPDTKQADPQQEKLTNEKILDYLRVYGPNARILLITRNSAIRELFLHDSDNALLRTHPKEFSAVDPRRQITHKLGGTIKLYTLDDLELKSGRIMGLQFGMVVFENLTEDDMKERTRYDVNATLRMPPFTKITSEDGICKCVWETHS